MTPSDASSPAEHPRPTDARAREFNETLVEALRAWRLRLEPSSLEGMRRHFLRMVEVNRRMNLTRITEPADAAIKHYADSLALLLCPDIAGVERLTLLDVGTGAGFPAVPLALARPTWQITALDATAKKVRFVAESAADLGLTNLDAVHGHLRHWKSPRRFDLITLRAVARAGECLPMAVPWVAPRGAIVLYQTAGGCSAHRCAGDEEWPAGERRLRRRVVRYTLCLRGEVFERALHVFQA